MALTKREKQHRYRERLRARLAAPSIAVLAADLTVPDSLLDPFHRAVRDRLARYLDDQGGAANLAATKHQQIVSLVEAELVLEPMTRDVQLLARAGHLWSLRSRRAAPLLTEWVRLKEHRDRLLKDVGLERVARPGPTLDQVVAEIMAEKAATAPQRLQDQRGAADGIETAAPPEIARSSGPARDDVADNAVADEPAIGDF